MKHFNNLLRSLAPVLLFLVAASPVRALNFSGTYTIPSVTFPDLQTACAQLTLGTVTGPTVFNITAGTYTGSTAQGILGGASGIAGLSSTNTVTFQPASGAGTVTLSPASSGSSDNYVFRLINVSYITIKDLTLSNTGSSYGTDIELRGNCNNNTISGCTLDGNTGTSTSTNKARVYANQGSSSDGLTGSNNVFSGNTINGGSYAFYMQGSNSAPSYPRPYNWKIANNTINNPYYGNMYMYYMDSLQITGNSTTVGSVGTFYGFYLNYCDKSMKVTGNTLNISATSGTFYGIYSNYCNGSPSARRVIANNTISNPSASSSVYAVNGYYCSYDSIANNNLSVLGSSGFYNYYQYNYDCVVKNNSFTFANGNYNTFYPWYDYSYGSSPNGKMVYDGNTFNCTTTTGYMYLYTCAYNDNSRVTNNTFNLTATSGGTVINYGIYFSNNCVYDNNTVTATSDGTMNYQSVYGLFVYNNSGNSNNTISNNKVYASGQYYTIGLYLYYTSNTKLFNNAIETGGNGSYNYTFQNYYHTGATTYYNNTIVNNSNATYNYTLYDYSFNSGGYAETLSWFNNVIYKATTAGSYPVLYMCPWNNGDYNNIYNEGSSTYFMQNSYSGPSYNTFVTWRDGSGTNRNSLSYKPVFMNLSTHDLRPDPSVSNCWAINGRGTHIAGNSTDAAGNARPVVPGAGVPDLGAFEFVPNSGVQPPLCDVTPATPAAGGTQTYTFGYDTVATLTWDPAASVPATAPTGQQWSGAKPPSISSVNNTFMYFYTDILTSSTANYTANIYYKDPWIGTIATENILHLAKKDGSNPWVVYPFGASAANTTRNYIFTPTTGPLNSFGSYTGLDLQNNAGATDIATPTGSFCAGTYNVVVRIKNLGSNTINNVKIDWKLDGVTQSGINYSTPISYNTGVAGSNEALISLGNVTFGAAPRTIKVWTSNPNGVGDTYNLDDTLNVIMRASLSGVYTVGGTTPDFATPTDAVNTLNAVGVCGPVTFNIRPGTYNLNTNCLQINSILGGGPAARVTFQAENGVASSVTINSSPTGSSTNGTFRLNGASYLTIRNLTINSSNANWTTGGSAIWGTNASYDSVLGCILTGPTYSTYTDQFTINFYNAGSSKYNVIQNCTINGGGYGCIGIYGSGNTNTGWVIDHNRVNDQTIQSYYALFLEYVDRITVTNNYITGGAFGGGTGGYGSYFYQLTNGPTITGNTWAGATMANVYGYFYLYYFQGSSPSASNPKRATFSNNIVVGGKPGGSNYNGVYAYGMQEASVYNNTFVDNSDYSGSSGYNLYVYATGPRDSFYNNVYWNGLSAGRTTGYFYLPSGNSHYMDYNNYYTNASNLLYFQGSTYSSFDAYRAASVSSYGYDKNSISYRPGVDSLTGLPVLSSPDVWSINGRGIQKSSNAKDMNGNLRPTTLAAGVPDIGAVEFDPTSIPPTAVATPAIPAPGVTQTYKFGGNPVAVIKWNPQLALTAQLRVRQYSGRVPPSNFAALTGGKQMYFYTDISPVGTGTTYDFNVENLYYYHTWLGTTNAASSTANELNMKLAEKVAGFPSWLSFNSANSITTTPISAMDGGSIYAPGMTSFGAMTGIDDGLNFTALVKVTGSTVLCSGNTVTLNADPTSGGSGTYTYQWKRNGIDIPGATSSTYAPNTGGDYSVTITGVGSQQSTSIPVTVTIVAPPMALITANGALTFCTGNNLQLSASGGGTAYQWQLNGSDIPGATDPTYKVSGAGTYTVKVSNIGCTTQSTATVVNAGPINVNLGADIATCEIKNKPIILDAGYPGAKYLWSTGDTTQTISIPSGKGTYSVTVDAGPNCKGSDQVEVNLYPLPSVQGISSQHYGNKYSLTAAGAANVDSYVWVFDDTLQVPGPSVTRTIDGSLNVKLIICNQCGCDTVNMVDWATNVSNVSSEGLDITVYPNPAKEKVNISITGGYMKDITVMNSVGEIVYRADLSGQVKTADVNVSGLASGRYIIRANTNNGIISKPFNVQQQ